MEDVAAGFYSPDVCFVEAEKYILHADKGQILRSPSFLKDVSGIIQLVDKSLYEDHELSPMHFDKSNPILPVGEQVSLRHQGAGSQTSTD